LLTFLSLRCSLTIGNAISHHQLTALVMRFRIQCVFALAAGRSASAVLEPKKERKSKEGRKSAHIPGECGIVADLQSERLLIVIPHRWVGLTTCRSHSRCSCPQCRRRSPGNAISRVTNSTCHEIPHAFKCIYPPLPLWMRSTLEIPLRLRRSPIWPLQQLARDNRIISKVCLSPEK
jgi:hypothetical protein